MRENEPFARWMATLEELSVCISEFLQSDDTLNECIQALEREYALLVARGMHGLANANTLARIFVHLAMDDYVAAERAMNSDAAHFYKSREYYHAAAFMRMYDDANQAGWVTLTLGLPTFYTKDLDNLIRRTNVPGYHH